ncbi:hypothetical protein [Mariniphaga sp.]|uniref:hypothetical protein n=1 Tax=Mariniphaga sp. TaxID=1954475 RepID=UPI00356725CE
MKTFLKIFIFAVLFGLLAGCEKTAEFFENETPDLKSAQPQKITVPFEANLLGEIASIDWEAQECIEEGYFVRVIVETTGNATHMGKVSLTFNFCSGGAPDPNIEGSKYTYAGSTADLIAANGDVLYLSFDDGIVMNGRTDEHPDDVYEYWRTPVSVLGGTGRFEGATGDLSSDDYVTTDDQTHHRFYGKITLVKGKK